ncbi:MAG TPA: hypothetical protein VGM39_14465 [Kofleriaceae bacterium]|jgi:hypothetical protein
MRRAGLACVLAIASTAVADTPKTAIQLRTEGELHAKRGEYAEAITSFKAADRVEPQAIYACMIGLTYMRRNLLAQAELFLGRCHTRARNETLPAWVATTDKQLLQAISDAKLAPVAFSVAPANASATVKLSGFADDETFDPRVLHLPDGTYTATASSPLGPDQVSTFELEGPELRQVQFSFEKPSVPADLVPTEPAPVDKPVVTEPVPTKIAAQPPSEREPPRVDSSDPRTRVAIILGITGGVFAVGGGVMHFVTWEKGKDLHDARTQADYDRLGKTFDNERVITFALYGTAAIALGACLYFDLHAHDSSPMVSAIPVDGGGMVSIGWQR